MTSLAERHVTVTTQWRQLAAEGGGRGGVGEAGGEQGENGRREGKGGGERDSKC